MSAAGESMKKLLAAGKGAEAQRLVFDEAAAMSRRYQEVRDDARLADAGKRQELAQLYAGAHKRVAEKLDVMASRIISIDRDDAGNVFGVANLPGDSASLAISRRDAADRVAAIEKREELQTLLRRATRSGDEVLARAVAERALEDLDDATMNLFLEDRPKLDAAANRLWNARRAESTPSFNNAVALADLAPHELFGLNQDAVAAVAEAEPAQAG